MKRNFVFLVYVLSVLFAGYCFSQVTTSQIRGKVLDDQNEPLPGALIKVVHMPTGTTYESESNEKGIFRIPNMKPGGPYKIVASFVGVGEKEQDNVYLTLGQTYQTTITLKEKEQNKIEAVTVVGAKSGGVFDKHKTGTSTKITKSQIEELPATGRLTDFVRLTPQADVSDNGAINIAGQNSRYNAIYIDGGINNDVFGLADSGTDGGQTGGNPFLRDELEELVVNVAPFDVRQSGFAGGAINAVTRSGTNNLHGSAYYFWRNQNLAGRTPPFNLGGERREKLPDFKVKTYGVSLHGPIIKDKLFFFANFEKEEHKTPRPFNFETYNGGSTKEQLNTLRKNIIDKYDYDPGTFSGSNNTLDATKFIGKIDWNISAKHRLSLKYKYTKFDQGSGAISDANNIRFSNNGRKFISTTHYGTLELNSNFNSKFSNQLLITGKSVRDDRDPLGKAFPYVQIFDNNKEKGTQGTISFGGDQFSSANKLDQDIYTFENNFNLYLGRHSLLIGTHNEYYKVSNLFIGRNYGYYRYSGYDNKTTGEFQGLNRYRLGFSRLDPNLAGDDIQRGRAAFSALQLAGYIQDEFSVTDNFTLTAGLRLDVPIYLDNPHENKGFNQTTLSRLEAAGYDLKGARSGKFIKPKLLFSPRLGFNWRLKNTYDTQIHGGIGVFTSRIPLVWPGGAFNNTGLSIASVDNQEKEGMLKDMPFEADVTKQYDNYEKAYKDAHAGEEPTPFLGDVDLYARDFKSPQFLKINLGIDQKLPYGVIASVDFLYDRTLNDIRLRNINIKGTQFNLTNGGDRRPYTGFQKHNPEKGIITRVSDKYEYIMFADNTHRGHAITFSTSLRKSWKNGLSTSLAYSYNDSRKVYDGSHSQNKSQWRGLQTSYASRNNWNVAQRSDFSFGSKLIGTLGYSVEYAKHFRSSISLIYNAVQSSPYSYVYGGRDGDITGESDYRGVNLVYVPKNANDIKLVDITSKSGAVIKTAAQQWKELDRYISDHPYLNARRGRYVERNGVRGQWSNVVDLRFLQDFFINLGGKKHELQFSLDIFNFTNLINKNWGIIKYKNDVQLLNFKGFVNRSTPTFTFDNDAVNNTTQVDDGGLNSSRWQIQLGLRYKF